MSILSILLFISLSLLNASNKLMICAALFVGAALVVNSMVEFYGRSKATYSLIACTVICCLFKLQNFSLMILVLYTAILVSLLSSIIIFEELKSKLNFHMANFVTLIIASIIDSTVVCVGLLYRFSSGKCLSIYIRDLTFKFSYASILSICLFTGMYLFCLINKKYFKIST
ncbi:putative ACR, YhhQ family protein [Wolbachia endosymbiont of Armadillidium vulgare str. wVulC]|uniref:Uncharacterized protein n=1 Tax=Wolbachia endosymbiont of Armadillidium arcangelii TaxID=3158571 RepID=A0AAU7Q3P4_9RICK|nr:putative ACR, YhhQ family protein [Wolbachia endosymbiont of Armadillidium vulgare str. wVulC]OJH31665.1 hypothetical protein Wxf_01059 [Wolbachia endosymbiont of Armadillidium vulgare]RDD35534.1 putative ACR, YhhQ family [Wolbachia endosymbiont of Cylisticus convexus]OJH32074.1 hypothetical protein Wxf_01493 [Wolbachia endosymbiont of Armadillidium vulgare]OJH32631.1 hypothetical protein Wxf_02073 [Wolbachia endosymbiont of Armadillidium vulgare]